MRPKLLTSLESLSDWLYKAIESDRGRTWTVIDFTDAHDLSSLQKFYTEMIPYIHELKKEIQDIDTLTDQYKDNESKLIEALKDRYYLSWLLGSWAFLFSSRKGISDLLDVFRMIKNNVDNIIYQVKINQD